MLENSNFCKIVWHRNDDNFLLFLVVFLSFLLGLFLTFDVGTIHVLMCRYRNIIIPIYSYFKLETLSANFLVAVWSQEKMVWCLISTSFTYQLWHIWMRPFSWHQVGICSRVIHFYFKWVTQLVLFIFALFCFVSFGRNIPHPELNTLLV